MMQNTIVRVLHVVKSLCRRQLPFGTTGAETLKRRTLKSWIATNNFVDEVTQRLTSSGISIETVVKEGHPEKVIIQEAGEWHPDLIGLGWHGHGKLTRLVTGDVSQYVIDHAPCSVKTVHQKEFNKKEFNKNE